MVQVTEGAGTPPTWQWKLTACPSTADWSTGCSLHLAGTDGHKVRTETSGHLPAPAPPDIHLMTGKLSVFG